MNGNPVLETPTGPILRGKATLRSKFEISKEQVPQFAQADLVCYALMAMLMPRIGAAAVDLRRKSMVI